MLFQFPTRFTVGSLAAFQAPENMYGCRGRIARTVLAQPATNTGMFGSPIVTGEITVWVSVPQISLV